MITVFPASSGKFPKFNPSFAFPFLGEFPKVPSDKTFPDLLSSLYLNFKDVFPSDVAFPLKTMYVFLL